MSISVEMAAAIRKCEGKKQGGSRYKGIHGEGKLCCSLVEKRVQTMLKVYPCM